MSRAPAEPVRRRAPPEPARGFALEGRRTSFVLLLVRATIVLVLWSAGVAGLVALAAWGEFLSTQRIPDHLIGERELPASRIVSARGVTIGGIERGARAWVPLADIGETALSALLAAEDDRFFRHEGVSARGVLRALAANQAAGRAVQGGSTITQQLAKTWVGTERTFARKVTELALARRIETRFTKAEILEAWANRVYFGDGATGIAAASELWFGVPPRDMTLAQAALLASVVPAPSAFHPRRDAERARRRRDRVLARMEALGLATTREVIAARAEPVALVARGVDRAHAPGWERAIWRELEAAEARQPLAADARRDGREVVATVDLVRQRVAEAAVREELHGLDRRQGWRGALGHVADEHRETVRDALSAHAEGAQGETRLAMVLEASGSRLVVWVSGDELVLGPDAWSWAVPWRRDARNHDERIDRIDGVVEPGDLVLVRRAQLAQWPRADAAWLSADLIDGSIEALVGGYDPDRSDFDRALQGCRQPGSTFKPFVYGAAFDAGWTPATIVRDAPVRYRLGPFEEWRPRNADGNFQGHGPVWDAFVWSRNLPALQLAREVGGRNVVARARALGIESPLAQVASLALGASCVRPVELLSAYHTMARHGVATGVHRVAAERDRHGRVRWTDPRALGAPPAARIADAWVRAARPEVPVVSRSSAFQVAWLLRDAVRFGTGGDLRRLGWPVAGKTGTTNLYDAWFAGFTAREAAVVWVGTDRNTRPLGRRESGGRLAVPAWGAGLLPVPTDWPLLPPPPAGIVLEAIDPETGELGAVDRYAIVVPFVAGTAPVRRALSQEELLVRDADRRLREF